MSTNGYPQNAAVWFEIPVRDLKKGSKFYGNILTADLKVGDGTERCRPVPG